MKRVMAAKRYRIFSGLLIAGAFALALTGCELLEDNPVNDEGEIQPIHENTDFDKPETSQDEIPVEEVKAGANQTGAEGQTTEEVDQSGTAGQTGYDGVDGEANKGQLDDALIQNLMETLSEAGPELLAGSCLFLKFAKKEVNNEEQAKIINELEKKFCPGDNAPNPNPDLIPSPPSNFLSPGQCNKQIMGPYTPGFTPAVLKKMAYDQCGSLGGSPNRMVIGRVNGQGLAQQAKYMCCAEKQPPKPTDPSASKKEVCGQMLSSWLKTLPKEDHFYTKPAFYICLEEGREEVMCEIIKKELPHRPSDFGKMVFQQHCADKPQPVEPPIDPCASIFENLKNLPPGNESFAKYHFTMCKNPGSAIPVCDIVLRELDRNPTQYGQELALQYCAGVTLPPPPPEPERPSPARIDSCETLVKSWEKSMSLKNDLAYSKPAFILCLGKDKDEMCDYIKNQLGKFPSDFGSTVFAENCVEEDAIPAPVQADTAAGCMLAARLWSVYFHLMTGAPNYGLIKDDAYLKCSQMMYTLVEPKPLCMDLENALPTVPPDSKEYATIKKAMLKAACQ